MKALKSKNAKPLKLQILKTSWSIFSNLGFLDLQKLWFSQIWAFEICEICKFGLSRFAKHVGFSAKLETIQLSESRMTLFSKPPNLGAHFNHACLWANDWQSPSVDTKEECKPMVSKSLGFGGIQACKQSSIVDAYGLSKYGNLGSPTNLEFSYRNRLGIW